MQLDRDQRPGLRIGQPMWRHHPAKSVASVAASGTNRGDLSILAVLIDHLTIARSDRGCHRLVVQRHHIGQLVHRGHQLAQRVRVDEVHTTIDECLHRSGRAGVSPRAQQLAQAPTGQVRVLLLTGQREFLLDYLGIQHEPGVVMSRLGDVLQCAEGVEPGKQRYRQPLARGIQP
ncbi:Uncharacterised protein [Mycobacterium tuberculosis]|uniref:Uncharacterized protein n=1 Tax=Mycobacterium tuberculosis TaxID=1773 RepID=A0A655IG47_MYCTX|nr:Uncharacterised protein [Mycobacterium tuberculosis]